MGNKISADYRQYLAAELPKYAAAIAEAIETTEPSVAIRLNPLKQATGKLPRIAGNGLTKVAWCDEGYYLDNRPDFTHDPAMHQGRYYVQDASSMAIGLIIKQLTGRCDRPLRYLDACAAPGGKTTSAIAALPAGSFVVANEYDFRRAEILKENVMKWGYPHVAVSRGDTSRLRQLAEAFDIVAADVPCSGEGMMRKDAKAAEQWTEGLVNQCAGRQREILSNLWPALRPGGYLIYSTCTFNTVENERMIDWLCREYGAEPIDLCADLFPGAEKPGTMLRFFPGFVRGEGLAIGVVRKPAGDGGATTGRSKKTKVKGAAANKRQAFPAEAADMLTFEPELLMADDGETLRAIGREHAPFAGELARALQLIYAGVEIGAVKGRKIVPSQGLALSAALRRGAFAETEADLTTALAYLRREALGGFDAPKGMLLLTYEGAPLGFVNHLGNRSNNLYPNAWRILGK